MQILTYLIRPVKFQTIIASKGLNSKITPLISVDNLSPIKQQRNTELKTRQRKRKHRRSTTSKQLKTKSLYSQRTQNLTWFGNVPTSTGRRGEIFI